jgi:predicted CopG family antitoxin
MMSSKTIVVSPDTHKALSLKKLEEGFTSLDDVIADLLKEAALRDIEEGIDQEAIPDDE